MTIREALPTDIPQIQIVRNAVKENMLSDPALVPDSDVDDYMFRRGKGWVAEENGIIFGFAIADLEDNNIWALFLHPDAEGKGIGKQLHKVMMDWYFSQTKETVWLSTGFNTRADTFYRMQGWREVGLYGTKETKFEMSFEDWSRLIH
ncbi:GNAT family N-acetyltransferase [Flavobacterium album]|uniref:GNAT family N-acetyltransferase n=1 Tax=Flavobacterium album TaxID=2175091 RepID=A0A2S1QXT2_9FLAO|nr:GNAT family N-acetyltransferase [Flavobacterium album]AWH85051.1 GNAT family N-acetyltransferase [Flavobacterium album]